MAIGDKKSLLQPSTVQSQQYRLQYSNLAPGGIAPASLTNQQPAPVANARPAASVFVTAPAPVSLQAPPTISPALPVPAPIPTPAPPYIPIDYAQSLYFDGSTVFTASLGINDVDIPLVLNDTFGIMFAIKPEDWTANEVIFSIYSGSFGSASLEMRAQNNTINMFFWNGPAYKRRGTWNKQVLASEAGKLGNGYTLITFNRTVNTDPITSTTLPPINVNESEWYINNTRVLGDIGGSGAYTVFHDLTGADHFDIGGTQKDPSLNFNGNIAFIAIKHNDIFTQQEVNDVFEQELRPVNLATSLPNIVRVYTAFDGLAVEHTGSAATTQVPLGIDGTVDFDKLDSYYS